MVQNFLDSSINYGIQETIQYIYVSLFNASIQARDSFLVLLCSNLTIFAAYFLELVLSKKWITNTLAILLYLAILAIHLILPVFALSKTKDHIFFVTFCVACLVAEGMKLFSYAHVNYCCRRLLLEREDKSKNPEEDTVKGKSEGDDKLLDEKDIQEDCISKDILPEDENLVENAIEDITKNEKSNEEFTKNESPKNKISPFILEIPEDHLELYPDILTIQNLYYFIMAPTLCYELDFPMIPKRRWSLILNHLVEFISLVYVYIALCKHWIYPILTKMDQQSQFLTFLQLCIPTLVIYFLGFYIYFHAYLNLLAELMRFSDRQFYGPIWNSESMFDYWRYWNARFNQWCKRHLYIPLIKSGWKKFFAQQAVFLLSDLFHTYAYYFAFKKILLGGMMTQPLLGRVIERIIGRGRGGNVFFWCFTIFAHAGVVIFSYEYLNKLS